MAIPAIKFEHYFIQLLKLIDLLSSPSGATIQSLEDRMGTSRRTIFRMLDNLKNELHFSVERRQSHQSREAVYFINTTDIIRFKHINLPKLRLSFTEAGLLQLLMGKDKELRSSELAADLDSLRQKLDTILGLFAQPTGSLEHLDARYGSSASHSPSYEGKEHIIDSLLQALEERHECSITYQAYSVGTIKSYLIQPLKLIHHRGALYLFIRVPKHDSVRIIAVSRIEDLELLPGTFKVPEGFDPDAMVAGAFDLTFDEPVEARIRISPKASPYVRERYIPGLFDETQDDGGFIILTIATSGRDDLLRWILSMGSDAIILDPPELRDRAIMSHKASLASYGDPL